MANRGRKWWWLLAIPVIAVVGAVLLTQRGDGGAGRPSAARGAVAASEAQRAELAPVDGDEAPRTASVERVEQGVELDAASATAQEETVREVVLRASVAQSDGSTEPVAGLRLRVDGRGRSAESIDGVEVRTDSRGEARLKAEPGAEFNLELVLASLPEGVLFPIELPGDRDETLEWSRLEVAAGPGPQVIDLRLSRGWKSRVGSTGKTRSREIGS